MCKFRLLAALVLVSVALVGCGDDDDQVTPTVASGAAATPIATTPAASPTAAAGQILFSGQLVGTTAETSTEYGIMSVGSDGKNLHRIGTGDARDEFPAWSPDGQQIAFTRFLTPPDAPNPRSVIVVMNADGSNERMLTDEDQASANPVWSPDGQWIAFHRVADPSQSQEDWEVTVSVTGTDGTNLHDAGSGTTYVTIPSWSPDGSEIVYSFSEQPAGGSPSALESSVIIAQADGSESRVILGPADLEKTMILSTDWSPDGSAIALVRFDQVAVESSPTADAEPIMTLSLVSPDGSDLRATTGDELLAAFFPAWSPDGRQLAFIGWKDPVNRSIYTVNSDGSDLRQLEEGMTGDIEEGEESMGGALVMAPSWSPDGAAIVYLAVPIGPGAFGTEPAGAELRQVAADGSEQRTIVDGFYVEPVPDPFDSLGSTAPDWQPEQE